MKAREIVIDGDIARVPLSGGYVAIIDAVDVHMVAGFNWSASESNGNVYAHRTDCSVRPYRKVILHRVLMGDPAGMHVDHRDGDGLNCRRKNMRVVTLQQNNINRGLRVTNKCGLKGVSTMKSGYVASICLAGVRRYLGIYKSAELAHAAYCMASEEIHGDYGRTQ